MRNELSKGNVLIETALVMITLLGLIVYGVSLSRSTYIRSSIQQQAEALTAEARGKLDHTFELSGFSASSFSNVEKTREEILDSLHDRVFELLPSGVKLAEVQHVDYYSSGGSSSTHHAALLFPGSSAKIPAWEGQVIHHSHGCVACSGANKINTATMPFEALLDRYPAEFLVAYESEFWPLGTRRKVVRVPFYLTGDHGFLPDVPPGGGPGVVPGSGGGGSGSGGVGSSGGGQPDCNRSQFLFNDRLCAMIPVPGVSAGPCSAFDKEECGPKVDENGAPVFERDFNGNLIVDHLGNPQQVIECKMVPGVCQWDKDIAGQECFEQNEHCYSSFGWPAPQYGDPGGANHRKTFKCLNQCLDGAPGQWVFNDRLCSTGGVGGAGSCDLVPYQCPYATNIAGRPCNEINKLCYSPFTWSAPQWGDMAGTHHRKVFKCLSHDYRGAGRMVFNDRGCAMTPKAGSAGPCSALPECPGTQDIAGTACTSVNQNCYSKFGWPFPEYGDPTGENHRKVFKCLPWLR